MVPLPVLSSEQVSICHLQQQLTNYCFPFKVSYSILKCNIVIQFCPRFRMMCQRLISHKLFDHIVLVFIFLNCITIALERPYYIQPSVSLLKCNLGYFRLIFVFVMLTGCTIQYVLLFFISGAKVPQYFQLCVHCDFCC